MKLILDIETNGFLDVLDKIHCMVFKDIETQKVYSYNPDQINEGLNLLKKATLIIGHSVMGFDLPAIEKVTGYKYEGEILDTLLCSRLIWTNMVEVDYTKKDLPPKLIGKHSIESWGYRLGLRKGDFAQTATFDVWTQDMQDYCERDVEVTYLLYKLIEKQNYSKQAIKLEHDFAHWIIKQEQGGVDFDETTAQSLFLSLTKQRLEIEQKLSAVFGSWRKSTGFKTYKRDNKKRGIKAGVPVEQFKTEIFNPNSRDHIADRLKTLGWKPKSFTATGKPEVNEKVLKSLPYEEAKLISRHLLIQKRLGQLSDGEQAYLKLNNKEKFMEKLSQMEQLQVAVRTSIQILHKSLQRVQSMALRCVAFLLLLPIWLCVVLIFLVWSFVCWQITCVIMTVEILRKHFLKMIYIPKISKYSDWKVGIKLKLLFMLTSILQEMNASLKYLVSLCKKPKE
jgi:hypothetical protein